jgi:hypothetical protein
MIFQNFGIFWDLRLVDFGRRGRGSPGSLKGYRSEQHAEDIAEEQPEKKKRIKKTPLVVDFSTQVGVYILHNRDRSIVYIGQTRRNSGSLLSRLREHSHGDLKGRWTHFSWFGLEPIKDGKISPEPSDPPKNILKSAVLNHLEGMLIAMIEPPLNKRGPNWKDTQKFLQYDLADFDKSAFIPLSDDAYSIWGKIDELEKRIENMVRDNNQRGDNS